MFLWTTFVLVFFLPSFFIPHLVAQGFESIKLQMISTVLTICTYVSLIDESQFHDPLLPNSGILLSVADNLESVDICQRLKDLILNIITLNQLDNQLVDINTLVIRIHCRRNFLCLLTNKSCL